MPFVNQELKYYKNIVDETGNVISQEESSINDYDNIQKNNNCHFIVSNNSLYLPVTKIRQYYKTIFESGEGGEYQTNIYEDCQARITCVGSGGKSIYKNYGENPAGCSNGGSGASFVGIMNLKADSYRIRVGNISDGNGNDSYVISKNYNISVLSPGGENGKEGKVVNGGDTPTFSSEYLVEILHNKNGNKGAWGKGGDGSDANYTKARTPSVYQPYNYRTEIYTTMSGGNKTTIHNNYGWGAGGGGTVSEYTNRSALYPPISGYVKIELLTDINDYTHYEDNIVYY